MAHPSSCFDQVGTELSEVHVDPETMLKHTYM